LTRLLFLSLLVAAGAGCAGNHAIVRRGPVGLPIAPPGPAIAWHAPAARSDASTLARWRAAVGPPVVHAPAVPHSAVADMLTIASWNTALGAADISGFVGTLPDPGAPLVLLLQEVVRGGPEVPDSLPPGAGFGRRHGGASLGPHFEDIEATARHLGFAAYYVPSMRNGPPRASDEDRGNAILSNLPLTDFMAVELPFERQRRVAVGATVAGVTTAGAPWRVRAVSAHLDNISGPRRGYIAAEYGRTRQARGLVALLAGSEPMVLGGDFNTWFGFADGAYLEAARAFPQTRVTDRRRTFRGLLRLDHVFYRLAPGWQADVRRAAARFGSDHYPLVGTVRFH
jgi:endonuclease/exonuclease/phosphatase family metal-dependent hydrolase